MRHKPATKCSWRIADNAVKAASGTAKGKHNMSDSRVNVRLGQIGLFAVIALVLLFAAACDIAEPKAPLSIGMNAWPGYEFLYLAQVKGFYEQEGVEVRLVEYGSLSDARRDFERGHLDAMASTLVEVLQAKHLSNRSPEVALVADFSNGADVIVARKDITSLAQLRGKRIGVESASLNEFILARALQNAGLKLADVERVALDQAAMAEAFANGKIDALVTYPPASVEVLSQPDAHRLFGSDEIPGEVVDVVAFDESVFKKRPGDIKAVLRAWGRAVDYAQVNRADAYAVMAAREGISAEEFTQAMDGLHPVPLAEQGAYFVDGSRLADVLKLVDETLRSAGVISGPDRSGCCLSQAQALYSGNGAER